MANYTVRPATLADADVLVHQRLRMFEDMGPMSGQDADAAALAAEFRAWLGEMMPAGHYVAWVVEDSDAPTGARIVAGGGATIIPWPPGPRYPGRQLAFVYNVFTEAPHRGRGLARLVMEAIHAYCRVARIRSLALNASEFGRPLYESMGYRVTRSPMMFFSLD